MIFGRPIRARTPACLGWASFAIGCVLCLASCREAPPLDGRAVCTLEQPADSVGVGDVLTLAVQTRWPAKAGQAHLAWFPPADTLLWIDRDSTLVELGETWQGVDYRMRLLATREGTWTIPAVILTSAAGETLAMSETRPLVVGSRVSSEETDLRPLADMVSLKRFPYKMVVAVLGLLAIALWALWWWSRRSHPGTETPEIPLAPPEEEFEERLGTLLAANYPERGEMRTFAQELSWVLRRYLGRRWDQPAVEATRPEILAWLPQTDLAVGDQQQLAAWLARTDGIKFAGDHPLLAETAELTEEARRIVGESENAHAAAHPAEKGEPTLSDDPEVEERA